jgi:curved DNA-binding protein CbpA
MTDYFALLGQPRRPLLSVELVKQRYHQLTRDHHPDLHVFPESDKFAEINEAYRILSNPKLRIQHLLEIEGCAPAPANRVPPADLQELFLQIGLLSQKVQGFFAGIARASSALTLSLVKNEAAKLRPEIERSLNDVSRAHEKCEIELRDLNDLWIQDHAAATPRLQILHDRLSYLSRWMDQLKEMQFQLATRD